MKKKENMQRNHLTLYSKTFCYNLTLSYLRGAYFFRKFAKTPISIRVKLYGEFTGTICSNGNFQISHSSLGY